MRNKIFYLFLFVLASFNVFSQNGGFEVVPYSDPEIPPGMIAIEGGNYLIDFITGGKVKKKIDHFLISKYEETNGQYLAYLHYLKRYYSKTIYEEALPDTSLWLKHQFHKEDTVRYIDLFRNYLRDLRFINFPVVGLTAAQIEKYCIWKTDRLNEMILIREGILDFDTLDNSTRFSTEAYLNGKYEGQVKQLIPRPDGTARKVRMEDGIFLPNYRLPTADEWLLANACFPDKKGSYPVTPSESKYRKFDKKNYFGYFYIKKKKYTPLKLFTVENSRIDTFQLRAVNDCYENNYSLQGMWGQVMEMVTNKPNRDYACMSDSWQRYGSSSTIIFNDSIISNKQYKTREEVHWGQGSIIEPDHAWASLGFRVAMSMPQYERSDKLPFKRKRSKKKN